MTKHLTTKKRWKHLPFLKRFCRFGEKYRKYFFGLIYSKISVLIYHITDAKRWDRALDLGYYEHESLQKEGFIHCSTLEQLPRTLQKHFSKQTEVIVLHIVERRIKELFKNEPSPDTGEMFPHIYGRIEAFAIEDLSIWEKNEDGTWERSS